MEILIQKGLSHAPAMMVTGHVLNMTGKIFENFVGKSVPENVISFRWKFVPRLFKTVYSILNCFC